MRRTLVCLILAGLVTAACGNDDPSSSPASGGGPATPGTADAAPGFPVEVAGITVPRRPERIVSLSATHTEIVYALGAGNQVVATDLFSDHPAEAADTVKIDSFNLNVEAVAGLDPDLVLYSFDPGDAESGFAALGIPALLLGAPATLEDAYLQILDVGIAVGAQAAATALVTDMRTEIEDIVAAAPHESGITYYHELDATLYTATSSTFVGRIYGLFGLENIADPADADGSGYPQLSAEFLLTADPDVIFLADTGYGESADTVAARPGWDALTAVQEGRVVELDPDVASRWGPRLVELVGVIARALVPVG